MILIFANDREDTDNEGSGSQCDAVTCTGLQPGSNVFVFGPEVQLTDDGEAIPVTEQVFIWIDEILVKLQRPVNPLPRLKNVINPLDRIISGMHHLSGDNMISGMFLLGV